MCKPTNTIPPMPISDTNNPAMNVVVKSETTNVGIHQENTMATNPYAAMQYKNPLPPTYEANRATLQEDDANPNATEIKKAPAPPAMGMIMQPHEQTMMNNKALEAAVAHAIKDRTADVKASEEETNVALAAMQEAAAIVLNEQQQQQQRKNGLAGLKRKNSSRDDDSHHSGNSSHPSEATPNGAATGSNKRKKSTHHRVPWEERIRQLKEYKDKHGDLLIPIRFKEVRYTALAELSLTENRTQGMRMENRSLQTRSCFFTHIYSSEPKPWKVCS